MADKVWSDKAYLIVCEVARRLAEFTPDDVWEAGLEMPADGRALGSVMARANRNGVIEKTWRSQRTRQIKSHSTDVAIWKSLIYQN